MTVVINGSHPEVEALLVRRREQGIDRSDEVWGGIHHVNPQASAAHSRLQVQLVRIFDEHLEPGELFLTVGFNLGFAGDYRVPDLGVHASAVSDLFIPTAIAVVEVVSPDDGTFGKFDFYSQHGVQEFVIVDPVNQSVRVWQHQGRYFVEGNRLTFLGLTCRMVENLIQWP